MSKVPRNIFPERKVAAGHSLVAKGLVEGGNVGGVMGMYIWVRVGSAPRPLPQKG
jgi:hypothetical protein